MRPEEIQKSLESQSDSYKKLQKDISKTNSRRSQLDSQLNENSLVKAEMDLLESNDVVYKLIGPALIRQDLNEAKSSVNKRIDYITSEIKSHESTLSTLEKDQDKKREEITKLQQELQPYLMKAAAK